MLTPIFKLSQDDHFIYCDVKAPMAKIAEVEVEIVDNELLFSAKPYYLRIYLPGKFAETGEETVDYNSDDQTFTIKAPKATVGELFNGLDMITELLTPKPVAGAASAKPLIEEIPNGEDEEEKIPDAEDEEEIQELFVPEPLPEKEETFEAADSKFGYGFAAKKQSVFRRFQEDIWQLIDIENPDEISNSDREMLALQLESEKFSENHYLADTFETPEVEEILKFAIKSDHLAEFFAEFSQEDQVRMINLPKRKYSLSTLEQKIVLASLADILYAFVYTFICFEGEENPEWGWAIAKISPTLSCLIAFESVEKALNHSIRRSVCFPIYRNLKIAQFTLNGVRRITKSRSAILKILLKIQEIMNTSGEYRYIFNELYITDYCAWIQSVDDKILAEFSSECESIKLNKTTIGLDLELLEMAAKSEIEELGEVDTNLLTKMRQMELKQ